MQNTNSIMDMYVILGKRCKIIMGSRMAKDWSTGGLILFSGQENDGQWIIYFKAESK